jgi:hypothetical protein
VEAITRNNWFVHHQMATVKHLIRPDNLVDILLALPASSPLQGPLTAVLERILAPTQQLASPERCSVGGKYLLTVAIPTFDDFDGVYFTVQALRLYHPELLARTEILVLDNNPQGRCAKALQNLMRAVQGGRYIGQGGWTGTAVRDYLFSAAQGEWVLVMDSHVLLAPGALSNLFQYINDHPDSNDLLQGPLLYDDLRHTATHFAPVWSGGMYGVWSCDSRGENPSGSPFEIPMQGVGVFACRKAAWPGFNPRMSGFGGDEGYLHEKFRQRGGTTYCLPFLRWVHRFDRPMGVPYQPQWSHRIRNYLIGWKELGLDQQAVIEHFEQLLGEEQARPIVETVLRECAGPFHCFDAIYSLSKHQDRSPWSAIDLEAKIRFSPTIEIPAYPEVARTLSHRYVLAEAQMQNADSVLVLDEQATPGQELFQQFQGHAELFSDGTWKIRRVRHAIAYRRQAIQELLAVIPQTPANAAIWVRQTGGLDVHLDAISNR